jgi:molybdate transport repressor ModE-like protein
MGAAGRVHPMDGVNPDPTGAPALTTTPAPAHPSPGVEQRHLAALAAVARARSFRGAARELGCSQSALSQHVAQLERLLGARLVERRAGSGDVALTVQGRALLPRVDRILATYVAARADLAALAAPGAGTLRVAVAAHLAATLPAAVAPALLRARPGLCLAFERGTGARAAADAVRAGRLDVAVGDPPPDPGALRVVPLAPEPCVLAVPANWAVARRAAATGAVGDLLAHLPIALDATDPDSARVVAELHAHGIVLGAVETAHSATIVPRALVAGDPDILALPLDGFVTPRAVCAIWHAERRHVEPIEAFAAALRDARATDNPNLVEARRGRLAGR